MYKGSCLCGAVRFEISGELRPAIACHCSQCQKTSGHYWAATSAADDAISFEVDTGLQWFQSSETAKRGFCNQCGSNLFWKPEGKARIAIAVGCLIEPTDLKLMAHVFAADKGDYYDIIDGLPVFEHFSGGEDA